MKIDTSSTRLRALLQQLPALEDILSWYDVSISAPELEMTLERLCKEYELELDDILNDIQLSLDDDPTAARKGSNHGQRDPGRR